MNSSLPCRACHEEAGTVILDLGLQPLSHNLLRPEDLEKPEPVFPLRLVLCRSCWLLQLPDPLPGVELFSENFYFSSFSDGMLQHARRTAERYINEFKLNAGKFVVEVGSNDGYLLQNFQAQEIPCLGVERAAPIASVARERGIETIEEDFTEALGQKIARSSGKADLVVANNVLAQAGDPNDFVLGLKRLLKPNGRAILEFPYARDLVEKTAFDTLQHQQSFYFSLSPLLPLFQRHNLSIFHVEQISIQGGSLRLFVCHDPIYPQSTAVIDLLNEERAIGMHGETYYRQFPIRVEALKQELLGMLRDLKKKGSRLAAYGASFRGSLLLNSFGIDGDLLDFVADETPQTDGRLTPGAHVPIVPAKELQLRKPDFTLLLNPDCAEEILQRQKNYLQAGGRFIIPLPSIRVVGGGGLEATS